MGVIIQTYIEKHGGEMLYYDKLTDFILFDSYEGRLASNFELYGFLILKIGADTLIDKSLWDDIGANWSEFCRAGAALVRGESFAMSFCEFQGEVVFTPVSNGEVRVVVRAPEARREAVANAHCLLQAIYREGKKFRDRYEMLSGQPVLDDISEGLELLSAAGYD